MSGGALPPRGRAPQCSAFVTLFRSPSWRAPPPPPPPPPRRPPPPPPPPPRANRAKNPPPPPPTRARPGRSAQRYADAVKRAKIAVAHTSDAVAQGLQDVELDRCLNIVAKHVPPKRAQERAADVFALAFTVPILTPSFPILDRVVADLDAI